MIPMPRWWKPVDNWQRWEQEAADALGLSLTVASGSKFFDPFDATSRGRDDPFPLAVDCKLTERASFSLKAKELRQYRKRAAEEGKRLVVPIRFWVPTLTPEDYVVMGFHDFVELRNGFCRQV